MSLVALLEAQNPWWREPAVRLARHRPARRDLQRDLLATLGGTRAAVILGARQVGKSTLLSQLVDDLLDRGWPPANITRFDFSDDRLTTPIGARDVVQAAPRGDERQRRVFFFDEIGLAPRWSLWLKQAVDAMRAGAREAYVVTDSTAALFTGAAEESGVGRWDEFSLETVTLHEFLRLNGVADGDAATAVRAQPELVERYLSVGGFPEFAHVERQDLRQARQQLGSELVERAILRDVPRMGPAAERGARIDTERVRRLLVYLLNASGAVFEASKWKDVLDSDPRAIRGWVERLEATRLLVRLGRHAVPASAGLKHAPRYYAADHGLILAFAPSAAPELDETVRGAVFEAVVFRHLREVVRERARRGYFRDIEGVEGDFVVQLEDRRLALVEVTASRIPRKAKVERVALAARRTKADRPILVYGGVLRDVQSGVELVPIDQFLIDPLAALHGEVSR